MWLDAQKTMGELQPGRDTKKTMEILKIFEENKPEVGELKCNLRDLTVLRNDIVMVSCRVSPSVFTAAGKMQYNLEERKQVGASH